jgi:hypothetical protein
MSERKEEKVMPENQASGRTRKVKRCERCGTAIKKGQLCDHCRMMENLYAE